MPDEEYTSSGTKTKLTIFGRYQEAKLDTVIGVYGADELFINTELNTGNGVNIVDKVDVGSSAFIAYEKIKAKGLTNWFIHAFEKDKFFYPQLVSKVVNLKEKDPSAVHRFLTHWSDNKFALNYMSHQPTHAQGIIFNDTSGQLQHDALEYVSNRFRNADLMLFINSSAYLRGHNRKRLQEHMPRFKRKHWFITAPLGTDGLSYHLMLGTDEPSSVQKLSDVFFSIEEELGAAFYESVCSTDKEIEEKQEAKLKVLLAS